MTMHWWLLYSLVPSGTGGMGMWVATALSTLQPTYTRKGAARAHG